MKKEIKLTVFSDAGHAWLKVERKKIPFKILEKISRFSYQYGENIYLEEDCDALLYINYLKENFPDIELKFNTHYSNVSRIRSYSGFELNLEEQKKVFKKEIITNALKNYDRFNCLYSTSEDEKMLIDAIRLIQKENLC